MSEESIEICILAGGLSSRMGRDKAKMRLGTRTLLGHVRATALATGCPVRVIRKDAVPRCGPLGGVFTGLTYCTVDWVLFLSCDMPFVTATWLLELIQSAVRDRDGTGALFTTSSGQPGFPFVLARRLLPEIESRLLKKQLSLTALATSLKAMLAEIPGGRSVELLNINTPEDWKLARSLWSTRCGMK